jgi:hypothetical protein
MSSAHSVSIHHEGPTRSPGFRFGGGHRGSCSCGWSSDCYAQLSDTERAIEVHLRKSERLDIDALIAKSSIGQGLADIKKRGINAHLVDLEREMKRRPRAAKRCRPKDLSTEEKALMRGFGIALASIWRCHHDGNLVKMIIKENNFKLSAFNNIGMLDTDLAAIRQAVRT